ncbi:MAG: hypothetical protein ABIH78_02970 [Candidatus Peregrinibacteria bacterium]
MKSIELRDRYEPANGGIAGLVPDTEFSNTGEGKTAKNSDRAPEETATSSTTEDRERAVVNTLISKALSSRQLG